MTCDQPNCDLEATHCSSRWTKPGDPLPDDVFELVELGKLTGTGMLVEYWCADHAPPDAEEIEDGINNDISDM